MKIMMVEDVQIMPEEFVDTMANLYINGGNYYFDTFQKWVDLMYIEVCGGLRFRIK